jgi:hypothetical protein
LRLFTGKGFGLRWIFRLIDRRFATGRPLQESLLGRRHENEESGTVNVDLLGGMAERRAGSGGTSAGTKALFSSRDDAPPAAAPYSARRRVLRAWRLTSNLLGSHFAKQTFSKDITPRAFRHYSINSQKSNQGERNHKLFRLPPPRLVHPRSAVFPSSCARRSRRARHFGVPCLIS